MKPQILPAAEAAKRHGESCPDTLRVGGFEIKPALEMPLRGKEKHATLYRAIHRIPTLGAGACIAIAVEDLGCTPAKAAKLANEWGYRHGYPVSTVSRDGKFWIKWRTVKGKAVKHDILPVTMFQANKRGRK